MERLRKPGGLHEYKLSSLEELAPNFAHLWEHMDYVHFISEVANNLELHSCLQAAQSQCVAPRPSSKLGQTNLSETVPCNESS